LQKKITFAKKFFKQQNKTLFIYKIIMTVNIPQTSQKRIVIIGCGFAGLALARSLKNSNYQVVILDKNNYHQFQPLFYQVATAGLEPTSISFPLRKIFQSYKNVFIRVAEVLKIDTENQIVECTLGSVKFDYLVVATGVNTSYFGMKNIEKYSIPMKSTSEALSLRNLILQNYENALSAQTQDAKEGLMNIVVVGGGPTGVEVSGALAEMKKYVLPKDYKELDCSKINIYLLEASPRVLNVMSEKTSEKTTKYLKKLGVNVISSAKVLDYDGKTVTIADKPSIRTDTLIWVAGIGGMKFEGIKPESYTRGNRLKANRFFQVEGYENIFVVGDMAFVTEEKYPNGHPQVARAAIQQAQHLGKNFKLMQKNLPLLGFSYKNWGSLATIGRNLAVAELPFGKFYGFFAWAMWIFVHLMTMVGIKNRLLIFINWFWNYITYDQSLRLIIKSKEKKE